MGENKLKIKIGNVEFEAESENCEFISNEREKFFASLPNVMAAFPSNYYNETNVQEEVVKELPEKRYVEKDNIPFSNLSSFIQEKGFASDTDLTIGTIYYCNCKENLEYFSTNDIKDKIRSAKKKLPNNISQCFTNLVSKGFIQPDNNVDGKKGNFYSITLEGIDFVEKYVKREKSKKVIKTKKNSNINLRYNDYTRDEFNVDNYPSIVSLNKNSDKAILVMYIAMKEKEIEYMEPRELQNLLLKIFNVNLTDATINGIFKNHKTLFYKRNSENNKGSKELKLVSEGIRYVEENILECK